MYNVLKIINEQIALVKNKTDIDVAQKINILASYYRSKDVLKENLFKFIFVYPKNALDLYKFQCENDLRTIRTDFDFDPVPKWQAIQKTVDNLSATIKYLDDDINELNAEQCKTALEFLYTHKKYLEYDKITNFKLVHTIEAIKYLEQYYTHLTGDCYEHR